MEPRTERGGARRLVPLLVLAGLLASAILFVGPALVASTGSSRWYRGPASAGGDEPSRAAGHARMVTLLEEVRVRSAVENPFLQTASVDRLSEMLARMPDDASELERAQLRFRLGTELLRVGRSSDAVAALGEAIERAEAIPGAMNRQEKAKAYYQLGVAQLREAEDRNCCLANNAESCILPIRGGGLHQDGESSRGAVRSFGRTLELAPPGSPMAIEARWLLNLAHMTLGSHPDGVPEEHRIDPRTFDSDEPFPRFVDVAAEVGLDHQDLAGGLVVEDLDGDGRLDVLTSTMDTAGEMRFYHNDGSGRLVDRTARADLEGLFGGLNMASADYDGDGDVDVLVLRGAWEGRKGRIPNSLLRNDGRAVFTDVTFEVGLGETAYPTQAAGWADYDNDGDLDLYVGNESEPRNPCPSELYRNDDGRGFTDVAARAGVTNDRYAKGVAWGDYDGDSWPDLFVSNMRHPNRLYHNEGDGTFRDVTDEAGVGLPRSGFGCWFFDYDNDGALDVFVGSYGGNGLPPRLGEVAASYLGLPHPGEPMRLYRGDGRGGFTDVTTEVGLDLFTLPMGVNFGDLDGDGWLDFYLGTGYPEYDVLIPNVMYRNRSGRGFADVTTAGGFGSLQKGHGAAFADLDEDGDQDVLMKMGGAFPGDAYRCLLFENPGFGHHWIEVRLVGRRSNRFGVGARIRIDVEEDGEPRSIHRTVGTGGSFGCGPLREHVGLGGAERIERLEVFWPTSGEHQVLEDLEVDQAIEIAEDRDGYSPRPVRPFELGG